MPLGDRKKYILSAIVNTYIETGEPVGSKLLAAAAGLGLSSATIRNEMSELAEMGFLEQPHTSAGRIPSQMGYRIYVDSLMEAYRLTLAERERIDRLLRIDGSDLDKLLERSGELLASLTGCAVVSAAPQDETVRVLKIEFVPTGRRTMLLVIITTSGVIKSRVCHVEEDITSEMVSFFTQLVNDKITSKTLGCITPALAVEITAELYEYTFTLGPLVDVIFEEIKGLLGSEVFLGGETNLLNHPEFESGKVLSMIRFLEKRDELVRLVDGVADGVSVRIGTENAPQLMRDSSLIAAPVAVRGRPTGAIAIIGPTRMNYSKLMSHIDYFSKVLSRLIYNTFSDE